MIETNEIRSSYQHYKHLSNAFVSWLISTYEDASSNTHRHHKQPHKKTNWRNNQEADQDGNQEPNSREHAQSKNTVADLESYAKVIVESPRHGLHRVPKSMLSCLYKIIQRRSEAHAYYCSRTDSDAASNDGHGHFIGILERIFDTMGGEAWLKEQVDSREEQLRNMEKADMDTKTFQSAQSPNSSGSSRPNRFFLISSLFADSSSVSDEEGEEDVNEWLPSQSSSSDNKPGRLCGSKNTNNKRRRRSSATAQRTKKRMNNSFPDLQFAEDESDDMFTRFCFFDDLNMLRGHVRKIWSEWATKPSLKGLVVASTATDVAVRMAESLEQKLLCHDAILAGWSAESIRDTLESLDGMIRASEDWTISLMSPYYAVLSGFDMSCMDGAQMMNIPTQSKARMIEPPGFGSSMDSASSSISSDAASASSSPSYSATSTANASSKNPTPSNYWASLVSRMSGEMNRSEYQPLLMPGESAFTHLLKEGRKSDTGYSLLPSAPSVQARLSTALESEEFEEIPASPQLRDADPVAQPEADDGTTTETLFDGLNTDEGGNALVATRFTPIIKPSLRFAGQLYLDINEITKNVNFEYQEAVNILGSKLYKYINWLSCHNLKKHVASYLLSAKMSEMTLLPMDDDITAMSNRRPFASRSLASRGVWQEGMGDFGRLVGLKMVSDVESEISRKAVAHIRPNRDNILNPWTCGSRATYILAEALHYGARAYNEGGMFIAVAHVYNAMRETYPSLKPWPLMESCLQIHGQDVFNGNRPTQAQTQSSNAPQEFFYNKWRLRMGLPLSEFSRGKRSGQFVKKNKRGSRDDSWGCSPSGSAGIQSINPDALGPSLVFARPKSNTARNTEGISKDVLVVKLVSKGMHLDWEDLKSLSNSSSRATFTSYASSASSTLSNAASYATSVDPGYVVRSVKERLEDDTEKMRWNLFAMEAFCQRVIERVLYSIPDKEGLLDMLRDCGMIPDDVSFSARKTKGSTKEGKEKVGGQGGNIGGMRGGWDFKDNLPVFAAFVLLLLTPSFYGNPLCTTWLDVLATYATEPQDDSLILLPVETGESPEDAAEVVEVAVAEAGAAGAEAVAGSG